MPTGPNRLSTIQRVVIRIDEVDIPNRAVHGYDKTNVLIVATFRETANGILYVPAQKERWIAERQGQGQWRLVTRLDSADQQAYVESTLGPGDMRIAAENIYFTGTVHGVGGGTVTSVTAGDASIVIGGTTTAPTVETADLYTISTLHATAGDVSMNSHKITNLTPGVSATDAATVSQIPTSLVSSFNTRTGAVTLLLSDVTGTGLSYSNVGALGATAAAGGDLTGNYPNPTIKTNVNLSGAPTTTTPSTADNSTKIATTAFVQAAIATDSVVRIQITQTSHGFSVGNVLIYNGTAYALAKADNADDAEVVGIVATVIDANNFILQATGEVIGLSGLAAGTTYFLSDSTAGLLTSTEPTTNGSISKPLGIAVSTTALFFFNMRGEVVSTNVGTPNVTTSPISSGPPSSPSTGDIWVATNVDANGTRWQFQYNAGSSHAEKWEFIGGGVLQFPYNDPDAYLNTLTSTGVTQGVGNTVYYDSNVALTLVRAGVYSVDGSYTLYNNSASANFVTCGPSWTSDLAGNTWTIQVMDGSLHWGNCGFARTAIGVSANDVLHIGLASTDPSSTQVRWNGGGCTPIRIA